MNLKEGCIISIGGCTSSNCLPPISRNVTHLVWLVLVNSCSLLYFTFLQVFINYLFNFRMQQRIKVTNWAIISGNHFSLHVKFGPPLVISRLLTVLDFLVIIGCTVLRTTEWSSKLQNHSLWNCKTLNYKSWVPLKLFKALLIAPFLNCTPIPFWWC